MLPVWTSQQRYVREGIIMDKGFCVLQEHLYSSSWFELGLYQSECVLQVAKSKAHHTDFFCWSLPQSDRALFTACYFFFKLLLGNHWITCPQLYRCFAVKLNGRSVPWNLHKKWTGRGHLLWFCLIGAFIRFTNTVPSLLYNVKLVFIFQILPYCYCKVISVYKG